MGREGDELPLLPEHWEQVRLGLRSLYLSLLWSLVSCGVVGLAFWVGGHRRLATHGPTGQVRALARIRLAVACIGVLALVLAIAADTTTDDATLRVVSVVPWMLTAIVELALWVLLGRALASWAGSPALAREWAVTGRSLAAGVVVVALLAALAALPPARVVAALLLVVVWFVAWMQLLFTSWRTYRLFSTPLVQTAPPPPTAADRT